jgi:predicted nucleic acid-binding protein
VITAVWDTSPLLHAARADRVDVLGDYARGPADSPWRNVTTATVVSELEHNGISTAPPWLEIVHVDELDELLATVTWTSRMGTQRGRNLGEATVCGWAEVHGAVAIIDDSDARAVAAAHDLPVHGSLWVVAWAVRENGASANSADAFVAELVGTGARYPRMPQGFTAWAKQVGLL